MHKSLKIIRIRVYIASFAWHRGGSVDANQEDYMRIEKITVSDSKYYLEFDGIRLIFEDERLIGWYRP